MKIKISNIVKDYLNKNESKYLLLLTIHKTFSKEVKQIRECLNIPLKEDGETIANFREIPDLNRLHKEAIKLVKKLNIPITLLPSIESIIQWGEVFITTTPITILGAENQLNRKFLYCEELRPNYTKITSDLKHKKVIEEAWYRSNKKILTDKSLLVAVPLIQINKRLIKSSLIKAIKQNWPLIYKAMVDLEKSSPFPLEIKNISTRDIKQLIKIYKLKEKGLSHQEIADRLHLAHDTAREYYSNFIKLLKKLNFISN